MAKKDELPGHVGAGHHGIDPVQFLREQPVPQAVSARPPAGFKPLDAAAVQRLNKIGGRNLSEAQAAIDEIAKDPSGYRADFGAKPDPAVAVPLAARLSAVSAAVRAAETELAYLKNLEDVVVHDVAAFLKLAGDDLIHAKTKDANVADRHPKLDAYTSSVGKAIADGIAQAKATRDAVAAASKPSK